MPRPLPPAARPALPAVAWAPTDPPQLYAAALLLRRAGALLLDTLRPSGHHVGCGNPYTDYGDCTPRCAETRAVIAEAQILLRGERPCISLHLSR